MNCGFCGKSFDEDRSQPACKACPLGTDCGLILCPHCGYENPGMPRWIAFLRDKLGWTSRHKAPEPPLRRKLSLPVIPTQEQRP